MKLDKYIIQLLAKNGTANIPGVGTLSLEHRNAILHNASILPPGDIVVFAENRECRDNTLAEMVMRDQKIKYEDALRIVNESAKEIDIESLCGWHNYLPKNYGTSPIAVSLIRHENLFADLGKYAAAVAVALMINLSIPVNKVSDNKIAEARLVPEFFHNTAQEEEQVLEAEEVVEPKNFCVIVSSLESREDAMNWIIGKQGCETMEIIEGDGHFRISAARFATYQEAATYIKNQNLTAWVLHTK